MNKQTTFYAAIFLFFSIHALIGMQEKNTSVQKFSDKKKLSLDESQFEEKFYQELRLRHDVGFHALEIKIMLLEAIKNPTLQQEVDLLNLYESRENYFNIYNQYTDSELDRNKIRNLKRSLDSLKNINN